MFIYKERHLQLAELEEKTMRKTIAAFMFQELYWFASWNQKEFFPLWHRINTFSSLPPCCSTQTEAPWSLIPDSCLATSLSSMNLGTQSCFWRICQSMRCIYCQLFLLLYQPSGSRERSDNTWSSRKLDTCFLNKPELKDRIYTAPALCSSSFLQQFSFSIRTPASEELYHQLGVPGRPAPSLAASDSDLDRQEGWSFRTAHRMAGIWCGSSEGNPICLDILIKKQNQTVPV